MSERVLAEVTGSVWKIMVQEGQEVVPEQTLVILESMKMEIPCEAAGAGTIAQILVSGEQIDDDARGRAQPDGREAQHRVVLHQGDRDVAVVSLKGRHAALLANRLLSHAIQLSRGHSDARGSQ